MKLKTTAGNCTTETKWTYIFLVVLSFLKDIKTMPVS